MQDTQQTARDWAYLVHKWTGLIAIPFLLLSIVLAVGLTHTRFLDALSDKLYPSLPIPEVKLDEPVKPGSWDQALRLANLATGKTGHVITSRDGGNLVMQSFEEHTHDPATAKTNPHLKIEIDTSSMQIVRVSDNSSSLVNKGHGIHAFRLFDQNWMSLSFVSSVTLLLLLVSGGAMVWRDRKANKQYAKASFWHVRAGQAIGVFILVIAITTLDFEFNWFGAGDRTASHPIPAVQLNGSLQAGSLDQARDLVRQATGALPLAVFIRKDGDDVKFSEAGDGIGGKSVWMNINTQTIERITDWRNDKQAFSFIIHDGRWLGGMNAFNINDAVALVMAFLVLGGAVLSWKKRMLDQKHPQS
ncbi:MAG: PepSY domain-containing protein [Gammaproteobacteria bacterium]|nr:PepSY domain-containing protein [Gammaproteobacteria bacterium]MBU1777830.1 PepSY domain-containing protein [Gammaproteobacteria bacterium]MBU1969388.1 PepSY domain-containing protein [Gammaproteobacteria bacterium]